MRGNDPQQGGMFSYISPEQRVRKDHPLRIRARVDQVLKELSNDFVEGAVFIQKPFTRTTLVARMSEVLKEVSPDQLITISPE
jgi:hypothetical protein